MISLPFFLLLYILIYFKTRQVALVPHRFSPRYQISKSFKFVLVRRYSQHLKFV